MSDVDQELQTQRDRDIQAMRTCVEHARDLLDSARAVFDIKHPNIAFHLALLALEELGRRELIGLQRVAETSGKERPWQKHTFLHTKKIFWCFFGAEFVAGHLQKHQLDSIKQLSETLHSQRMAGLYVDYQDENLTIPSEAIDPAYCAALLDRCFRGLRWLRSTFASYRNGGPEIYICDAATGAGVQRLRI